MKNAQRFTALIALTLIAFAAGTAAATQGVSPGEIDRVATIEQRCPTFSWGGDINAAAYELVAYRLPESEQEAAELSSENEVLFASVAGAATSWTPSADQCFVGGERYVWFVRSVTELIDDQVIEAGEWSAGRYFTVPAGPSADELERALEVLKRWEAANTGGKASPSVAGARSGGPRPTLRHSSSGSARGDADAGWASPKSVTTAESAIRGEHPDITGEVYGVVGTSASADGAGVAAMNLDGGPDLVLDGETNGESDTVFTEGGIDRPSANSEVFEVKNSGPGGIQLNVGGEIAATSLNCPDCVDSATIVDGSVGTADLSDDAVTGAKLADGAVGESDLRSNAVTTGKIADGTIVQADLALSSVSKNNIQDNAVVSGKILDGTIASADLADAAVTSAKIADGTIASADIGSSQINSIHILNMSVDTAELAPDAVTSSKIENGTITAVDVATDGGVYSTRGALYSREHSVVVSAGHSGSISSSCDDLNDLPLQGGCRTQGVSNVNYLQDAYFANWSDPSISPTFHCTFVNNGVDDVTAYASMVCVGVPGLL